MTSCTQSSTVLIQHRHLLDPKPAPLGLGSLLDPTPAPTGLGSLLDPTPAPNGLGSLAGLVRFPILKAKPSSTAMFGNTEQGSYFILDTYCE
jgi:hypothetical protein